MIIKLIVGSIIAAAIIGVGYFITEYAS